MLCFSGFYVLKLRYTFSRLLDEMFNVFWNVMGCLLDFNGN